MLALGRTVMVFRDSAGAGLSETHFGDSDVRPPVLSEAQRRVLTALCRPYKTSGPFTTPATNLQIAEELCLSVEAVKTHLRALFARFKVDDLPQGHKRAKLVERAEEWGAPNRRTIVRPGRATPVAGRRCLRRPSRSPPAGPAKRCAKPSAPPVRWTGC